jgi:hypothetical protein
MKTITTILLVILLFLALGAYLTGDTLSAIFFALLALLVKPNGSK